MSTNGMSRDDILATLTRVFREVFDDDSIVLTPTTTAADIEEWDSLNQIKIILACERAFGLRLKPRDVNALDDIGAMVDHVADLLAARG